MCRFVFYMGPPVTVASLVSDPAHSLIKQSFDARERTEPLNGDGFGLSWYSPMHGTMPATFKSVSPAWANNNLLELARVVESQCILAHIRAATQGSVNENNCHPFRRGRLSFMHNGDIGGFPRLRRHILNRLSDAAFHSIRGATDTEHFFALVQDAIGEKCADPEASFTGEELVDGLRDAIATTLELLETFAPSHSFNLNCVLSDGVHAIACRYTDDESHQGSSLYINEGRNYSCEDGVCRMVAPGSDGGSVVVASEPLSSDPGWQRVERNSSMLIESGRLVGHTAMNL